MATNPGECDNATIAANGAAALEMVGNRRYALTDVHINGSNTTETASTVYGRR